MQLLYARILCHQDLDMDLSFFPPIDAPSFIAILVPVYRSVIGLNVLSLHHLPIVCTGVKIMLDALVTRASIILSELKKECRTGETNRCHK